MHSGDQSAHDVCTSRICVLCWAPIPAHCTFVGAIHVITMSMAVFPIFQMLVRSGRALGLMHAGTAAKPGGLLWEITTTTTGDTTGTAIAVAATVASVTAVVECGLLL